MIVISKKRYDHIDYMKALGILLVVFGHMFRLSESGSVVYDTIVRNIYSFHMPLFFMISGAVLRFGAKEEAKPVSLRVFAIKNLKSLVVPYLIWSGVYIGIWAVRYHGKTSVIRDGLCSTLTCRGVAPLWFLICLFTGEIVFLIIYILLSKALKGKPRTCAGIIAAVSMAASTVCSRLSEDISSESMTVSYLATAFFRLFPTLFFLSAGFIGADFLRDRYEKLREKKVLLCICAAVSLGALCGVNCIFPYYANMHTFSFTSITVFFITGILGSLAVFFICMLIPEGIRMLSSVGKRSKHIMIFHYPPIPIYKAVSIVFTFSGIGSMFFLKAVSVLALSCLVSAAYDKTAGIISEHFKKPQHNV